MWCKAEAAQPSAPSAHPRARLVACNTELMHCVPWGIPTPNFTHINTLHTWLAQKEIDEALRWLCRVPLIRRLHFGMLLSCLRHELAAVRTQRLLRPQLHSLSQT